MSESACCNLPPVQADYTPKGEETQFSGLKTYITGPADAKAAIFIIYDVFGFANQTLQGADLLASQGYRVYLPDLLEGKYMNPAWFDGSAEGEKARKDYFSTFPGSAGTQSDAVGKVIAEIKGKHEKVGVLGFCWGWKAAVLAKDINKVDAIAACHPSFAANDDLDKVTVPICLYPSKDEDMKVMQALFDAAEKSLPGKNKLKRFDTVGHGFAAARADLKGDEGRKQYSAAYTGVAEFFKARLV